MNKIKLITKEYCYLTIEPYCFLSVKEKKAIIYNTFSKKSLIITKAVIINLLGQMDVPANGRTILIEKERLNDSTIQLFIANLKDKYMGDIFCFPKNNKKPFQLVPKPFFEKDIEKVKDTEDLSYYFSFDISQFINDIFISINNECHANCQDCQYLYKQTAFCTKFDNTENEFKFRLLEELLKKIYIIKNVNINIIGGDIFLYSNFTGLVRLLIENPANTIFYSHYVNFTKVLNFSDIIDNITNFEFIILVNFPLNNNEFKRAITLIQKLNFKYKLKFIIRNEIEMNSVEQIIKSYRLLNYEIMPFFNGKNLNFLKENVFLDKSDLNTISLNMRDIFANMTINSIDYGRFFINVQGQVFSNRYLKPVGNIFSDDIFKIVHKELLGGGWRRIRNYEPCENCIYQFLCPPPTNLELAIKTNKICNIENEKDEDNN